MSHSEQTTDMLTMAIGKGRNNSCKVGDICIETVYRRNVQSMIIRQANIDDLDAVTELESRCFPAAEAADRKSILIQAE